MKVKNLINLVDDAWIEIYVCKDNGGFSVKQYENEDLTPYYEDEIYFISGGMYDTENPFSQYVLIGVER